MKIPFSRPYYTGKEDEYVRDAMNRKKLAGDGFYTKEVHKFLEETFNADKALFTTSGSSALDLSALLVGLDKDDEVIMPSYTFSSTANAVALRGARIVFAEIDPMTMNMDVEDMARKITKNTKAIFPMHYAGVACEMDEIMKQANERGITVVEDAAQAVNATYKDKFLGTIGHMGCYSFHDTKNYVCGEGGALLIKQNENLSERAEILREKGTNRSKFLRGQVDKYTWVDIGSSFLGSDILAAFLLAQLEELDDINNRRKNIYDSYYNGLKNLCDKGLMRLPFVPEYCRTNYHMFYMILNDEATRDGLMKYLQSAGITAVFHYIPLHSAPMGVSMGYKKDDLPLTEEYSARLLRLPLYADMTREEIDYVIAHVQKYFG